MIWCLARQPKTHQQHNDQLHNQHNNNTRNNKQTQQVALNFVPNRRDFLDRLAGGRFTRASEADLLAYAARFGALLADVHAALDARGLDDPAKV